MLELITRSSDFLSREEEGVYDPFPTYQRRPQTPPAFQAIDALDLEGVKYKLCRPEKKGGYAWTKEHVNKVEKLYRMFLKLHAINNKFPLVPSRDVDMFWHMHILFTWEYINQCQEVFGHYFHHTPFIGSEEEYQELFSKNAKLTEDLYYKHFGVRLNVMEGAEAHSKGGEHCGSRG